MQKTENTPSKFSSSKLVKRLGVAGFLFFLIKGLLWLIVPVVLIWLGISC